jgi:hypothetical protein
LSTLGDVAHTGTNLCSLFRGSIANWELDNKVVAIAVDNAANMKNGVLYSDNVLIPCSAHTLQLCVKDAFSEVQALEPVLDKCRCIVRYFKKSSKVLMRLHTIQNAKKLDIYKFQSEVKI